MNWEGALRDFVRESNRIERILRDPTDEELYATRAFLLLPALHVTDVEQLVRVYAPGNTLRRYSGQNINVGGRSCPLGGPLIPHALGTLLYEAQEEHCDPYSVHVAYELLHPFTDGNGRSGRALWAWMMVRNGYSLHLGFLHMFYYQALQHAAVKLGI